jgi:hypothetical protein
VVVESVEQAQSELTAALGLTWNRVQRRAVRLDSPDGLIETAMIYTYSTQGPPYLELIEQQPGTPFGQLGLHHMAVWSDDPKESSRHFEELGWPRETVSLAPDGSWAGGLFHVLSGGLRIEVVDIAKSGPKLARYVNGGDYA